MAEHSAIEWTDATWNPVTGCSVVSPGCTHCYAMKLAGGRLRHHPSRRGLTAPSKAGRVWTGEVRLNEDWLDLPLRWNARAPDDPRGPLRIFVCAHGDLFHEAVPDAWIDRVFAVMALAPQHSFQVLTKRSARMREYMENPESLGRVYDLVCDLTMAALLRVVLIAPGQDEAAAPAGPRIYLGSWPLRNVWLGVSVEDQARADERIPDLLATPAAVRFVSCEPLLGAVDLETAWHGESALDSECWGECAWCSQGFPPLHNCQRGRQSEAEANRGRSGIDWVICGGESGTRARPMHPDWARSLRDQCATAGVPFFFKQWGEWAEVGPVYQDSDDARTPAILDALAEDEGRGCILAPDGGRWPECQPPDGSVVLLRLGKKRAGRMLDGVVHDGFPDTAASPLIPSARRDAARPGADCPSPTRGEGSAA